jgi:prepilin-type N-terminal cleavage/methylation domain-containing protein
MHKISIPKFKAFTLIEIVIVLVISSTVITLAMWSYLNVAKYLKTYAENEHQNQELALFITHFSMDLDEASQVVENRDYLQLQFENNTPVEYDFYSDKIIRYCNNFPDTFLVSIRQVDYIPESNTDDWISEIHLDIGISSVQFPLVFYKFYTPQQLFQAYEY